jgi:hypothetical protein
VKRVHKEYWAQMCTYGFKKQLRYALFVMVNKNDDDKIENVRKAVNQFQKGYPLYQ